MTMSGRVETATTGPVIMTQSIRISRVSAALAALALACEDPELTGPNNPGEKGCWGCKWWGEEEAAPTPVHASPGLPLASAPFGRQGPPSCTTGNPASRGCTGCIVWAVDGGSVVHLFGVESEVWKLELDFAEDTVDLTAADVEWQADGWVSAVLPASSVAMGPLVGGQVTWFETAELNYCCDGDDCQWVPSGIAITAPVIPAFVD